MFAWLNRARASPFEGRPRREPRAREAAPLAPAGPAPATPTAQGQAARAQLNSHYVDDAVAAVGQDLDDEGVTNVVTDGEARHALKTLLALPPHLQGQAIARLSDDQFDGFLREVPEKDRERLLSLVENTHDPERKLRLFGAFHPAFAAGTVDRLGGSRGAFFPGAAERETQRQNSRRFDAVATTRREIDAEVRALLGKHGLTEADVQAMMERKTLEHELEMTYALSLTNEAGTRRDGSRIVWETQDLRALDAGLRPLPGEHAAHNSHLLEIRREDDAGSVGADHLNGVVRAYDAGMSALTLTHEVGHNVAEQHEGTYDKYVAAAGWQNLSATEARAAGLSRDEVHRLQESRSENGWVRGSIERNGRSYRVDPYDGSYWAVDEGALPTGQTWGYATSHPDEQFAEHYAHAVHDPFAVHEDFVAGPAREEATAQRAANAAHQRLAALEASGADGAAREQAEAANAAAARALAIARRATRARRKQFDLMRNEIFHTDDATRDVATRLRERGVPPETIAAFEKLAAEQSTPAQIEALAASLWR